MNEAKLKVKLLAHTPEPEKLIARAAKLCYSSVGIDEIMEDLTDENVGKFLNILMDYGHCYDEKTEVLTSNGFKKWKDIKYEDKLGVFNPTDQTFECFENPTEIISQDYNGKMFHFKSKMSDLMITQNHRLYCSISNTQESRSNPKFKIYKANEILKTGKQVSESPIRMTSVAKNKNKEIKDNDYI